MIFNGIYIISLNYVNKAYKYENIYMKSEILMKKCLLMFT